MVEMSDERVPVVVRSAAAHAAAPARPDDAVVAAGPPTDGPHPAACACCQPRSALGRELGRLFSARARGEVAFFRRVVVVTDGEDAFQRTRRLIAADGVASARYRLDPG